MLRQGLERSGEWYPVPWVRKDSLCRRVKVDSVGVPGLV